MDHEAEAVEMIAVAAQHTDRVRNLAAVAGPVHNALSVGGQAGEGQEAAVVVRIREEHGRLEAAGVEAVQSWGIRH